MLVALDKILDKLASHCEARKIDPAVFLQARLYPDMFPFVRQVQLACDFSKGAAARLSGQAVPSWPDDEADIAALKARIGKTLDFIASVPAEMVDASENKVLMIKLGRNSPEMELPGKVYLLKVALPNFYFHVTMAYAILRHNGLEIGKFDYLDRA
jgi:hypothetical protein